MKNYAELGHVHRTEPCVEYPGEWLVYVPVSSRHSGELSFSSLELALKYARALIETLEHECVEYNPREISICWKCSDNDPRVGQVWFTGFYQHGQFNAWGRYVS